MAKAATKNKLITPRDIELFHYLFENKAALGSQIARDVFKGRHESVVNRRLAKLYLGGWIERTALADLSRMKLVYHLSDKSFRQYVKHECHQYTHTQLKSDSPGHDLVLLEIQNVFKKLEYVTRYQTENTILLESNTSPDNVFSLAGSARSDSLISLTLPSGTHYQVPLEYESATKSRNRYRQKVIQYHTLSDFSAVLYVYDQPSIRKTMSELEAELIQNRKPKFFFCKLSQVLNHNGLITFSNQKGEKIELK